MKSIIKLFKALEVKTKTKKQSKELLNKTISKGFVFSPVVISNYSKPELLDFINVIEKELGLNADKLNNSFHKSWKKIKNSSIEQLVIEQIMHYMTTYGFEELGCYDKDSVYIPHEKLEIPELKENIKLIIINGYTKEEIKTKLLTMLQSGIAFSEDTLKAIIEVASSLELKEQEIETIKNKEAKIFLYDKLDLIPENNVEFLRFLIYKVTGKTLLIKNKDTIKKIKENEEFDAYKLLKKYDLTKLSEIFNRFKPIFLAFKKEKKINGLINKLNKLAKTHHKPMKEDFLNTITARINRNEKIDTTELLKTLEKVNVFRKIRLAYALKYRTNENLESIIYKVRNGKGYATEFTFKNQDYAKEILKVVLDSVAKDISKNVKGKKVYIPQDVTYTLPATEKQFTGNLPSGTYIKTDKDMIVGVSWENVGGQRVDLDLSLLNTDGKLGWDGGYRSSTADVLFSGDITDAPLPNGASEMFYVKKQKKGIYLLNLNYFNCQENIDVPFKIFIAKEKVADLNRNYMVNPNNVLAVTKTSVTNDKPQKTLGLLILKSDECRFYFSEVCIGKSITSSVNNASEHSRKYLLDFYQNSIDLNGVLKSAGVIFVKKQEDADINLSLESLEKDTILQLFY